MVKTGEDGLADRELVLQAVLSGETVRDVVGVGRTGCRDTDASPGRHGRAREGGR